jgi:HAMP domain-containing protein
MSSFQPEAPALRLLAKFNIMLILLFGIGLFLISEISHRFLLENARQQTLQQAQLMVASARSTREYTERELDPLLERTPDHTQRFLPQTIPFYAATVTFERLRGEFPDYTYKEAALNPTNPRDRASDWESDIINDFKNHPEMKQTIGERATPSGGALYLAHPITADSGCLECHGIPSRAPVTMLKTYGSANGFGWNQGETIGAQIVSVPTAVPVHVAEVAFRTLMIYLTGIFLAVMLVIDLGLYFIVILPLRKLSAAADRISKGDLAEPGFAQSGKDEISAVAKSFHRMYVSMVKALQMLEGPE